ncbi:MAG: MFS transporter [Thermodesulfobacteriota bacterium]
MAEHQSLSGVRADWFPVAVLSLYTVAVSITTFFVTVFFKEAMGFSAFQIGLLISIQAMTGILAAFPAGAGNDRFSSHLLITGSLVIQALCFFALATARSFTAVALFYMTWGLFSWVFRLSMDVYFLKTDTRNAIGRRIGFYQSWRFAGMITGTIGTGYIIDRLNFSGAFTIVAGVCVALALVSAFMPATVVARVRLADYRADFSSRRVLFFSFWVLLFASHWGAEQTCYALFLRNDLGLSFRGLGWYFAAEYVAIIIALTLAGQVVGAKAGFRKLAVSGLLLSGLGNIGMVMKPVSVSVLFRAVHGLGDGFMVVVMYYGISRLFSLAHLGGNAGLVHLFSMVGYIIGAMVYSPVGASFGYGHPLWVSGLLTMLLALPVVIISRDNRRKA